MKIAITLALGGSLALGLLVGLYNAPADPFRANFEAATGVHPDSFMAAGKDCENANHEKCRIYGGWAPRSQFADPATESGQ